MTLQTDDLQVGAVAPTFTCAANAGQVSLAAATDDRHVSERQPSGHWAQQPARPWLDIGHHAGRRLRRLAGCRVAREH